MQSCGLGRMLGVKRLHGTSKLLPCVYHRKGNKRICPECRRMSQLSDFLSLATAPTTAMSSTGKQRGHSAPLGLINGGVFIFRFPNDCIILIEITLSIESWRSK